MVRLEVLHPGPVEVEVEVVGMTVLVVPTLLRHGPLVVVVVHLIPQLETKVATVLLRPLHGAHPVLQEARHTDTATTRAATIPAHPPEPLLLA